MPMCRDSRPDCASMIRTGVLLTVPGGSRCPGDDHASVAAIRRLWSWGNRRQDRRRQKRDIGRDVAPEAATVPNNVENVVEALVFAFSVTEQLPIPLQALPYPVR